MIGDLQGCLSSFKQLAAQLPAADRYIFVGDLVNRGFESLATLRHVKERVERGDRLFEVQAQARRVPEAVRARLSSSFAIEERPFEPAALCGARL